jgi:hypothetical protein
MSMAPTSMSMPGRSSATGRTGRLAGGGGQTGLAEVGHTGRTGLPTGAGGQTGLGVAGRTGRTGPPTVAGEWTGLGVVGRLGQVGPPTAAGGWAGLGRMGLGLAGPAPQVWGREVGLLLWGSVWRPDGLVVNQLGGWGLAFMMALSWCTSHNVAHTMCGYG